MSVKTEIEARLRAAFDLQLLEVINESYKHAGHMGDDGTGESHFHITLRGPAFAAMSRIARHRAVHAALGDINSRVHAIALDIA